MKRVRDIMVPIHLYPSVRDNSTLREAVAVIENAQLEVKFRKSLPRVLLVFDGIDVLVGTVRRRDIMRGLEPKFLVSKPLEYRMKLFDVQVDPNLSDLYFDRVVDGVREQADRPVSDVMRPIDTILTADDTLLKALYELVSYDLSLIPVVEEGQLVGVVRSVDAFQALADMLK